MPFNFAAFCSYLKLFNFLDIWNMLLKHLTFIEHSLLEWCVKLTKKIEPYFKKKTASYFKWDIYLINFMIT